MIFYLTYIRRNQTRITGAKNKRLAQRLSTYGFVGIGMEIDFLDPITGGSLPDAAVLSTQSTKEREFN